MELDLSRFSYGIFDADGTIFNSVPLYTKTFADLLLPYGFKREKAESFFRETSGAPLDEQFSQILKIDPRDNLCAAIVSNLVERFFEITSEEASTLMNGAREVLDVLSLNNIELFMTSGTKTEILEKRLKGLRINCFRKVLGSDRIRKGLGHIGFFVGVSGEKALGEFARKSFYVGDGPLDMEIARKAKICAVGLCSTVSEAALYQAGADKIIHSLMELIS